MIQDLVQKMVSIFRRRTLLISSVYSSCPEKKLKDRPGTRYIPWQSLPAGDFLINKTV
jgi:hypothetical protein